MAYPADLAAAVLSAATARPGWNKTAQGAPVSAGASVAAALGASPPLTGSGLLELLEQLSLADLSRLGLTQRFSMLADVLQAFRRAMPRLAPNEHNKPRLFLELKGRALSHNSLAFIARE